MRCWKTSARTATNTGARRATVGRCSHQLSKKRMSAWWVGGPDRARVISPTLTVNRLNFGQTTDSWARPDYRACARCADAVRADHDLASRCQEAVDQLQPAVAGGHGPHPRQRAGRGGGTRETSERIGAGAATS